MKIIPTIAIIYACLFIIVCQYTNIGSSVKNSSQNSLRKQSNKNRTGVGLQQLAAVDMTYQQFLLRFKPQLINKQSRQQYEFRTLIFNRNKQRINKHNSNPNNSYTLKITQFADMTPDQFQTSFTKLTIPEIPINKQVIDWSCLVSPVSDLNCQQSYPKAVLDSIEVTLRIHGSPYKLFTEQLTYCTRDAVNFYGCKGQIAPLYMYVKNIGVGVVKQQYSKDTRKNLEGLQCPKIMNNQQYKKQKLFIKDYKFINNDKECVLLLKQLRVRSLTVFVDDNFINRYSFGVYKDPIVWQSGRMSAVAVIGYEPSQKSLVIKGNFGLEWGHNGNAFIGVNTGICSLAYYPILFSQQQNPRMCG